MAGNGMRCPALFALVLVVAPVMAATNVSFRHLGPANGDVGQRVFRSSAEWRRAVTANRWSGGPNVPTWPRVNWNREMVIAASAGEKPTTGYDVRITKVQRAGNELVVTVRETAPPPGTMQGQMVTYPSDAVAVPRFSGPVRFVVERSGGERGAGSLGNPGGTVTRRTETTRKGYGAPYVAGSKGLAKSVFAVWESGGIAGLDRRTVVRLYGRPVSAAELGGSVRTARDVEITGPAMRKLEVTARDSGFMDLASRYTGGPNVRDAMARTIRVEVDGKIKSVTVEDGADVPAAFETMWTAIQDALTAKGSTVHPK